MNFREFARGLIICASLAASTAFGLPRGAIHLNPEEMFSIEAIECGKIEGIWQAGKNLGEGYFIDHRQVATNLQRRARNAETRSKNKRLRRQAAEARDQYKNEEAICLNGPVVCDSNNVGGPSTLQFDFTNANALAVVNKSALCVGKGTTRTNLRNVKLDGTLSEAAIGGSATIKEFKVLNDKALLLFESAVNLVDTTTTGTCMVAAVPLNTGIPSCIATTSDHVPSSIADAQIDQTGGIYYVAYSESFIRELYRNIGGTETPLLPGRLIDEYYVYPSGKVLAGSFQTVLHTPGSLHLISADTSKKDFSLPSYGLGLAGGQMCGMHLFPDGNVYISLCNYNNTEENIIVRFITADEIVDTRQWFGVAADNSYTSRETLCAKKAQAKSQSVKSFCAKEGVQMRSIVSTADNIVFAGVGTQAGAKVLGPAKLFTLYSSIASQNSAVEYVDGLALLDDGATHGVLVFSANEEAVPTDVYWRNPATSEETRVVHLSSQYGATGFHLMPTARTIVTEAVDYSQFKYVLYLTNYDTGAVTIVPTGTIGLKQLETF